MVDDDFSSGISDLKPEEYLCPIYKTEADKFRHYIEMAPDGIFVMDDAGRLVEINKSACRMSGYSEEEILHFSIRDLLAEKSLQDGLAHFTKVMETGSATSDLWHKCKDGSERHWCVNAVKLSENRILGFCKDITDNKCVEEALREEKTKANAIFEQVAVGIVRIGLDGRYLQVNQKLCDIMGYAGGELLAKRFQEVTYQEDLSAVLEGLRQLLAGEIKSYSVGKRCVRKNGMLIWVNLTVSLVRNKIGEPDYYVGVVEDISGSKRMEEMLLQSQKMEAVGQLAGGVAHDFNNILTALLGTVDLMRDDMSPDDPKLGDLEDIKRSAERATVLTRQLLAFSRRQMLQPKVFNMNDVVTGMKRMFPRLIREDIALVTNLAKDLWKVKADIGQIEQVMMNIVVNARDAISGQGKIVIETGNIELEGFHSADHDVIAPNSYVMLAVSDTGSGMSEETRKHIFEPFFTTKEKGKGTGLGLATVYGIVKQSNGYIWVYSEPGRGTTFRIYLPRTSEGRKTAHRLQEMSKEAGAMGSETVLLVEDEEDVRRVATRILKQYNYTVIEACNGEEALDVYNKRKNEIGLIITDTIMPRMGGLEMMKNIASSGSSVKALFISGYTDVLIAENGLLNPGVNYLQKPFTAQALCRKVRTILDGT